MLSKLRSSIKPAYLITATVLLIGLGFVIAEFNQIVTALHKANWRALPGGLFFTVISYLSMSISFALVCKLFSLKMPMRDCAEVGFVTNVINHVLTTGGVAGFSLRIILMGKKNVPARDVIAVSMMHFYLASLDMMVMFPAGILLLMNNAQLPPSVKGLLGTIAGASILLALIATLIIFNPDLRVLVLSWIAALARIIIRRDFSTTFAQFNRTMTRGIALMRQKPLILLEVITLTAVDWFASVFVLRYCLLAFGAQVGLTTVITGFVIGIMVGLASLVPGGLVFQEGSMTWVLVLLGVGLGQAILAAILFRGLFFYLPYLFSLLFYRHLLKPASNPAESLPGEA